MIFLYPCAYDNLLKADDVYEKERLLALENNHEVLLFNYDCYTLLNRKLVVVSDDKENKFNNGFETKTFVVYRGWMMKPDVYEKFYNDLLEFNIQLINSPL